MMIFFRILLFLSAIHGSYISMYGFGEYVEDNYFKKSFILESSDYLVENNFSPIWLDSKSIFSIQYNFQSSEFASKSLSDSYLSAVSYSFPIKRGIYSTIGFNPYTISNASFYDYHYKSLDVSNISGLDDNIIYNVFYSNKGGISKAYIDFSFQIFDKFCLGFKYSYLFGNLEQNIAIRKYELDYDLNESQTEPIYSYSLDDSILINRVTQYKGSSFQLESKYNFDNVDLFLSGLYDFPLQVSSNYFYDNNLTNLEQIQAYVPVNQNISYKNRSMVKKITLGLKYSLGDMSYTFLKLSKQNSFTYNSNSMYLPDPDIYGIDLWYNLISKIFVSSKLNYMNYRLGVFHRTMDFGDFSDYDYGLSFDCKIRFSDMNSYSIFIKKGNKTYNHIDLDGEQYYLIGLRLENLENWFLKGVQK